MKSGKKPIVEFANKLFESREKAHVFHLQTKVFAEHEALDIFYKQVIKLIDEFVEVYQGQFGIIEDYQFITKDTRIIEQLMILIPNSYPPNSFSNSSIISLLPINMGVRWCSSVG